MDREHFFDREKLLLFLRENLSIHVKQGDFTDPNSRTIELKLGDEVISTDYFNVVQTREYEG